MTETKCRTDGCESPATRRIFWPGNKPIPLCDPCTEHAKKMGSELGFRVGVEPIKDTDTIMGKESDK